MKKRIRIFACKHPLSFIGITSIIGGHLLIFLWWLWLVIFDGMSGQSILEFVTESFYFCIIIGTIAGLFLIPPILFTMIELCSLWKEIKGRESKIELRHIDLTAIGLGTVYNIVFLSMLDAVEFGTDWYEVLHNTQKHTPIFTESYPTVWAIIAVGILGYCIVNFLPIDKIPPLAMVLGLASMYLGTGFSIVWLIHVFQGKFLLEAFLFLLPICSVCITARTVMRKVKEWQEKEQMEADCSQRRQGRQGEDENDSQESLEKQLKSKNDSPFWKSRLSYQRKLPIKQNILSKCNDILADSRCWPVAAFLLMWPLLGILIGILVLFGQKPDAIIKAFTETSDWNLSQKMAPQNLYMDEHYLCTVAAGGHEKVVKPIRLGVRHGHQVIVNRQLCVANAFEQILEEKTPGFHKCVRRFYDTYGFPIGKWIMKSKVAADVTYFVMKPLEWMFLIVLYLADVNPENRIAIQYTGKRLGDF